MLFTSNIIAASVVAVAVVAAVVVVDDVDVVWIVALLRLLSPQSHQVA